VETEWLTLGSVSSQNMIQEESLPGGRVEVKGWCQRKDKAKTNQSDMLTQAVNDRVVVPGCATAGESSRLGKLHEALIARHP
jgi:hypothetical protein